MTLGPTIKFSRFRRFWSCCKCNKILPRAISLKIKQLHAHVSATIGFSAFSG